MTPALTVGSLFSGIGGIELGLERAGMRTLWQVEQDEYCRRVLAKHWPDALRFDDVRTVGSHNLPAVDLLCGGFPCQDISYAGEGAGLDGERSGLWSEFARLVGELRPRYVIVENVAALLNRGIDVVLGDLAALRYDAEWSVVSACSVGAPHMRQRLFIVAYPHGVNGWQGIWNPASQQEWAVQAEHRFQSARTGWRARLADPSALYGNANGVPAGPHRNRAIGNAVVPQVAEYIGHRITAHATRSQESAA